MLTKVGYKDVQVGLEGVASVTVRCTLIFGGLAVLAGFLDLVGAQEPAGAKDPKVQRLIDPEAEPFRFENNGLRDPFTYILVKKKVTEKGVPITRVDPFQEIKKTAEESYELARNQFKQVQYNQAITSCDKGLAAFNRDGVDPAQMIPLQGLREKLFSLRAAAERLNNRQIAQRAFGQLNYRVAGVVAKERNSMAIVNGKIIARGDLIEASDQASESAIVDEIQPGRVIVRFRGFRMELSASR